MTGKRMRCAAFAMAGLFALFAAPAYSADLGTKNPGRAGSATVPMPDPIPIRTSALWAGLSLGGHAGGATQGDENAVGGGHLGYSLQNGHIVYGAEGDVSFGKNTVAAIRGRLGIAAGHSWHLYGTAGVAFRDGDEGLVAGGGLEYRVANNTSIGAEALYYDLDEDFTVIRGRVTWHFGGSIH